MRHSRGLIFAFAAHVTGRRFCSRFYDEGQLSLKRDPGVGNAETLADCWPLQ
jgi:hypothetical protein